MYSLNLKSQNEWENYCKFGDKPNDIPSSPDRTYKNSGWLSWSDWLGTKPGFVSNNWLPFEEAREFVHSLNLKSQKEWKDYCKFGNKPNNIPCNPDKKYKNCGWLSWSDWLGTKPGFISNDYLSFEEARKFVHSLSLKSIKEWNIYCKSGNFPKDIPKVPDQKYENEGWLSYPDFLGYNIGFTGEINWLPFEEVREFIWSLKLKNEDEWIEYWKNNKRPYNLPSAPAKVYENEGWLSWPDWLGTKPGFTGNNWMSFDELKQFVIDNNIKTQPEWFNFWKNNERPYNIPSNVRTVYKNEWVNWGNFSGTGNIQNKDKVIAESKDEDLNNFFKKNNIKNKRNQILDSNQKNDYVESEEDILNKKNKILVYGYIYFLVSPNGRTYIGQTSDISSRFGSYKNITCYQQPKLYNSLEKYRWENFKTYKLVFYNISLYDLLELEKYYIKLCDTLKDGLNGTIGGDGNIYDYLSFEEAREFVHSLNLKSQTEWRKYCKSGDKPNDIPSNLCKIYKKNKKWLSFPDFLGTKPGFIDNNWLPFEELKQFVKENDITSQNEWKLYWKNNERPNNIPYCPDKTYKNNGWTTWGNFLDTGRVADHLKIFRPFEEARKFVHSLGFKNENEWNEYCKFGDKPNDIPRDLYTVYKKNKKWLSFPDFLGYNMGFTGNDYLPFEELKQFVKENSITFQGEWFNFWKLNKKPDNISYHPDRTYKDEWISWYDFLDTKPGFINNPSWTGHVGQFTLDNQLVVIFDTMKEINEKLKFDTSNISKCLNNKQKTAYGFKWKRSKNIEELNKF